ncbi:hypothetical protein E2C01_040489 [Portunus trituberculatus]|uniref:Uncharacterized protein n=1 Tax=Portunus trituberculatus TaxID=210409 RepID=A0A5B7FNX1_PORTR|nr:hypothetical protein [Portunus trituberculatus]
MWRIKIVKFWPLISCLPQGLPNVNKMVLSYTNL